jgi:hypothetical protein
MNYVKSLFGGVAAKSDLGIKWCCELSGENFYPTVVKVAIKGLFSQRMYTF